MDVTPRDLLQRFGFNGRQEAMRRRRVLRWTALPVLCGLVLIGSAGSAAAGEYNINACQGDRLGLSSQAFEDFATRGMMWKRACDPEGPGLRGLVTANVVRPGTVPRGA